jgi:hypothetical protein
MKKSFFFFVLQSSSGRDDWIAGGYILNLFTAVIETLGGVFTTLFFPCNSRMGPKS